MSATIGVALLTLHLEESFSLKDKRREVRSICQQVQNQFNAAIAEVADLDDIRLATLAVTVVSNDARHAERMLATITEFVDRRLDLATLGETTTELIPIHC